MKKWIWIIISIVALILLAVRGFMVQVDGVKEERQWYLSQLNFEFSGMVDSVIFPRRILFHVTHGNLDREKEKELKGKLKRSGYLDLLLYKPNDQAEIFIGLKQECRKGDSLYLNTHQNVVRIYRDHKLISENELLKSLRGRPF